MCQCTFLHSFCRIKQTKGTPQSAADAVGGLQPLVAAAPPGGAHLPVLSDGVPHAHLPRVARGHQLVPDEEERIHGHAEAEHA